MKNFANLLSVITIMVEGAFLFGIGIGIPNFILGFQISIKLSCFSFLVWKTFSSEVFADRWTFLPISVRIMRLVVVQNKIASSGRVFKKFDWDTYRKRKRCLSNLSTVAFIAQNVSVLAIGIIYDKLGTFKSRVLSLLSINVGLLMLAFTEENNWLTFPGTKWDKDRPSYKLNLGMTLYSSGGFALTVTNLPLGQEKFLLRVWRLTDS